MFPIGFIGMFWVAAVALAIVFVAVRIAHNGRAVESLGQVLYDTEHPEKRR
jgi:hypothetical protein